MTAFSQAARELPLRMAQPSFHSPDKSWRLLYLGESQPSAAQVQSDLSLPEDVKAEERATRSDTASPWETRLPAGHIAPQPWAYARSAAEPAR